MGFFQFGRKLDLVKEYSLDEIPLFSSLTSAEQKVVEKKARLLEYKRGDIIYREGTEPDAFYVVISGRLRLFTCARPDHVEQTLIFFYRGDHFGEASILTEKSHRATVEAKSDGMMLKLDRHDFLKLVKDIPALSLHLNRSLGHRLARSEGRGGERREVKIAALYSLVNSQSVNHVWMDFATALGRQEKGRSVILLDFHPSSIYFGADAFRNRGPEDFDIDKKDPSDSELVLQSIAEHTEGFSYLRVLAEESSERTEKKIAALVTFMTYRFDYLLIRVPQSFTHIGSYPLKQSDLVYFHAPADPQTFPEGSQVIDEFITGCGFAKNEVKMLVPESRDKHAPTFEEQELMLGHRIFALLPEKEFVPERYQVTMNYMAKEMAGTLLGLALGSGAAYGLAHIGVLKVLEEEGISVDVIAGSSIGALVGAIWAAGHTAADLERLAFSITKKTGFFKLVGFRDISLAHWGFFKGQQVMRFLETYIGNKTFQDLRIPLRVTACNIQTAEEVVFRTGSVTEAVRASISIPGIFRPCDHNGQQLIDGGVIDPMPVQVLSKMGVKKIIGVNVLPSPDDWSQRFQLQRESRKKELELLREKGFWRQRLGMLGESLSQKYAVNVFNVIMNTIQFMEYELAHTWGNEADIVIHPIVKQGHWAEFYSPGKFIQVGVEKTREQLSAIRALLMEESQ